MNMKSSFPSGPIQGNDLSPSGSLRPRTPEKPVELNGWQRLLNGWYYLTAPKEVSANAPLAQREASRRGRLASIVLLFATLLVLPGFPAALGNPIMIAILFSVLFIDVLAFVLNRGGRTTIAGILVVVGMEVGLISSILGVGTLATSNLPTFDLLVQAECVAVSLLPPVSVFIVAIINITFIISALLFSPHQPDLAHLLNTSAPALISSPIILQIIVAIVTFLWVTSANKAIIRADRAEEIAALEQREVERQQQEISQKHQLDEGIHQILQTHVQVANGDYASRAPLNRDNILWQIAYSLNNLLARLQRLNNADQELNRAKAETARLVETIRRAKSAQKTVQIPQTGTYLDPLLIEMFGVGAANNPPSGSQPPSGSLHDGPSVQVRKRINNSDYR